MPSQIITRTLQHAIKSETSDFDLNNVELYSQLLNAFQIPPDNIDEQEYLRLRSRAFRELRQSIREWKPNDGTLFVDAFADPFVRAALIFELTNLFVSLKPSLNAFLLADDSAINGKKTMAEAIDRFQADLKLFSTHPSLSALCNSESVKKLAIELEKLRGTLSYDNKLNDEKLARIFHNDKIHDDVKFPPKARPQEIYVGIFTFNVVELLKHGATIDREDSFRFFSLFFDEVFSLNYTWLALKDKHRDNREHRKKVLTDDYERIFNRLQCELPISAKQFKQRLFLSR